MHVTGFIVQQQNVYKELTYDGRRRSIIFVYMFKVNIHNFIKRLMGYKTN